MIYSSYQVQQTTCLKSFHFLSVYTKKGFSSGGTVWSATWASTASITTPGGRDLDRFFEIFENLGRAGDI